MNSYTWVSILGFGQSRIVFTLSGSIVISFLLTTKPSILILVTLNSDFLSLANSLFSLRCYK